MRYWLTTHWPPHEQQPEDEVGGIYLEEGKQVVGANIAPGDLVFIYQSLTGPTELRQQADGSTIRLRPWRGRGGIVSLECVTSKIMQDEDPTQTEYTDRRPMVWSWSASTRTLNSSGFVPKTDVNRVLEYKHGNRLHGFGTKRSGLMEISERQFEELVEIFKRNAPPPMDKRIKGGTGTGTGHGWGESEEHRKLKGWIATLPTDALGESGLTTIQEEYPFPTGDRIDVLLEDHYGRVVAVEVEVEIGPGQIEGPLQALKYCAMASLTRRKKPGEGRAVLIAYDICDEILKLCVEYKIETHIIPSLPAEFQNPGS